MSAFKEYILLTCLILFLNVAVGQKDTIDIGSESPDLAPIKFLNGYPVVGSYIPKVPAGTCSYAGEKLPDDTDCNIFHLCEGTPPTPVRLQCVPDNVSFNPNTNQCDPNYTCESGIKCTASGQKFENPDNCASYYICSATLEPVPVYCGENQFYSQDYGNCRNTTYVDCGERPGCIQPGDSFPNYKDCNSFFACNGTSFPVKLYCPSGQSWDSISNRCLPSANAHCAGTTQKECSVPGQKLPNPKDHSCQSYYICNSHFELNLWTCPYGQQFDSQKLQCRPCEFVECGNHF